MALSLTHLSVRCLPKCHFSRQLCSGHPARTPFLLRCYFPSPLLPAGTLCTDPCLLGCFFPGEGMLVGTGALLIFLSFPGPGIAPGAWQPSTNICSVSSPSPATFLLYQQAGLMSPLYLLARLVSLPWPAVTSTYNIEAQTAPPPPPNSLKASLPSYF